MELITKYLGIHKEENVVALHYVDSDSLAKEYTFANESDAELFYDACKKLDELVSEAPEDKQVVLHKGLIEKFIAGKEYELTIY